MTRTITRFFLGGAAAAALALSASCSSGLQAQTAEQVAPVPGFSARLDVPNNGSVSVQDVLVAYPGIDGYKAGANAPLQIRLFNNTQSPVTVKISSADAAGATLTSPGAAASASASPSARPSASPKPGASASGSPAASASPSPTAAPTQAAGPVTVTVPAGSFLQLDPTTKQYVQLTGLKKPLGVGDLIQVKFEFSGPALTNAPTSSIDAVLSVAPPLSAGPRSPVAVVPTGTPGVG